ncbi:hypothetical protein ACGFIR_25600 [Micromonospora sp. NPDC049051]|uniref:hypothetical protein n=1 Tax=unclassified Micromonospora TaxID=2617518 RepID=UPI003710A6C6
MAWSGAVDAANPDAKDFLAVIDATKGSRSYGRVVNTATFGPQRQNEPHHMQYVWHKGQRIYAGGIFSDTVFVLDASRLPVLRITGVNLPADTPCGSAPDAFAVLSDGTAYASYMGGPNVPGPCTYSDGQVRVGNGYAGSPGEIVRIGKDGRTISEIATALPYGEDPTKCHNYPALEKATCANPHGIAVREDLNRMVVTDYTEIKNNLNPPTPEIDPLWLRDTVRIFDITNRNRPKLKSVSRLPDGPRVDEPAFAEPRMVMEPAVTHQPRHRGAFASTMAGGAVYYTPDITKPDPEWREVFDDSTAYRKFDTSGLLSGSNSGGSWLWVTPDDRFLVHTVMGADWRLPRDAQTGMVYVLDIQKLLASGNNPKCKIDEIEEVTAGGHESDCPALTGVMPVRDTVSTFAGVGPHWGAMDNFTRGRDGIYRENGGLSRIASANYFVSPLLDGDHRICMYDFSASGEVSMDTSFRDEVNGAECLNFNRQKWPHGSVGEARPHGLLFVVSDSVLR